MKRWSLQRALGAGVAGALILLLAGSCGDADEKGGLMLVVSEDGSLGLDRLDLDVSSKNQTLFQRSFSMPEEAQLPATLGVASNGDSNATVAIRVGGWRGGVPVDVRDVIVTQVPVDRVAALHVVLSNKCTHHVVLEDGVLKSTCAAGEEPMTCDPTTGKCVSAQVDGSTLGDYRPGEGPSPLDAGGAGGLAGAGGSGGVGGAGGSGGVGGVGGSGGSGGTAGAGGQDAGPTCGDQLREGSENCDGSDLGGETCASLGFDSGQLACKADCSFDLSQCAGDPCSTQPTCTAGTEQTQACGKCGSQSRTCSSSCVWGGWSACAGEGVCSSGAKQSQGCGKCGTQERTCSSSCAWGNWGTCTGQGLCSPGAQQTQPCGDCGTRTRTCTSSCSWGSWSTCSGQGVCSPGAQQNQACGNCGTRTRTCTSSCSWGGWGTCSGQGVCSPGAQQNQACGNCGTQTRTCTSSCSWSNWGTCSGQGACSPGAQQSQACGNCGTRTRTCSSSCAWGSYGSCTGEGVCAPGTVQTYHCTVPPYCTDDFKSRTCTSQCQWPPGLWPNCGPLCQTP